MRGKGKWFCCNIGIYHWYQVKIFVNYIYNTSQMISFKRSRLYDPLNHMLVFLNIWFSAFEAKSHPSRQHNSYSQLLEVARNLEPLAPKLKLETPLGVFLRNRLQNSYKTRKSAPTCRDAVTTLFSGIRITYSYNFSDEITLYRYLSSLKNWF